MSASQRLSILGGYFLRGGYEQSLSKHRTQKRDRMRKLIRRFRVRCFETDRDCRSLHQFSIRRRRENKMTTNEVRRAPRASTIATLPPRTRLPRMRVRVLVPHSTSRSELASLSPASSSSPAVRRRSPRRWPLLVDRLLARVRDLLLRELVRHGRSTRVVSFSRETRAGGASP